MNAVPESHPSPGRANPFAPSPGLLGLLAVPLLAALLAVHPPAGAAETGGAGAETRPADNPPPATAAVAAPTPGASDAKPADNAPPATKPSSTPAPPPAALIPEGERGLRLNFRGVPLDMVLNYLSEAAGFIINLETEVKGKVDVWSNQPLDRDEAVQLLNTVLKKNGYAAIRNDRMLTIVARDEAMKRDIPVVSGNIPANIPRNDEIVTQILPVRFINATQLVKDLTPLLPTSATMTANEGGNALVITDSQINIRRMAEIIQALDTAVASVSNVRVFSLQYSDSKALATVLSQLFQNQDAGRGGNNNQGGAGRFFNQFRGGFPGAPGGGGFPGGPGGAGGAGGSAASGNSRAPTPRVVAVADERSNSVIVSAPDEQMQVIEGIVKQVDTNVEDITELRVFRLAHADPQETADLLNQLFQDSSTSTQGGGARGQVRFGGAFGGFGGRGGGFSGGGRGASGVDTSARMLAQTRVNAVPDLRTRSVVVSAARDLIDQISKMIEQLDADPARKQKVFVYDVENTDPQAIQEVIETLFPEQSQNVNRNNRSTQRQNSNQLNNRQTQNRNNQNRNTGFGGNTGGGGFGNTGGR